MLKSYVKFVFVREPFERLLSAYLNKFYSGKPSFLKRYGRDIIRRYRPGGKIEVKNKTFHQYVNYVINTRNENWDEHWQTYDKLCHPCGIQYDFIARFEHLKEEAKFVFELSGISRKMNVSFPPFKPSNTLSKVPFFYSQIAKEQLQKLVQLLRGDSEMFGCELLNFLPARITSAD